MQIINIHQATQEEVLSATLKVLQGGGLIIFPTETTYGAGVDALNQEAVNKLLAYKSRREGKPLSIAVCDAEMAEKYVEVSDSARRIYERFLPGPVTVISKSLGKVAEGVTSEFGTLGIRWPDYPLVVKLVRQLGRPITATSANGSGEKRPYSIQDISDGLSEKQKSLIDLVLDAGQLPPNPPSTVIDTTLSTPVVFRQGNTEVIAHTEVTEVVSHSEKETKEIAERLILKHWNDVKEKGLVIGLNGSLGMGKTIFVKGVAEFLQIQDIITSPTYTYIEEYDFHRHGVDGQLIHLDVWKVESGAEMERLQFPDLLGPNQVVIVEWASNVASYLKEVITTTTIPYLEVEFSGQAETRTLKIKES
jgi:L-threonylcarbamoyladenylate synthase